MPPLYVFPTGLAYHGACCAAEVLELAPPQVRRGALWVLSVDALRGIG